jgi:Fe-S cluster assembly protein SufB
MKKYTENELEQDLKTKEYEYGFYTDIEADKFPPGLNEAVVIAISKKKNEPQWMTDWRLEAFRIWEKMIEPEWANVHYVKPHFNEISYYSAPKKKPELESLDQVDPELLKTFAKLGISMDEQKRLSGVAMDIVVDSVSVATTFKKTLEERGIIFCPISEAIQKYPDLVKKYMGSVVPKTDNFLCSFEFSCFFRRFVLLYSKRR